MMRDKVVTVFGGTGFVGTQVVKRLAQQGARIRVVTRAPNSSLDLKPLGDVGQIVLVPWRGTSEADLAPLVKDAQLVVNLVGILFERKRGDFERVHGEFAGNVAKASAAAGVERLVQMSAIGADPESPAQYGQSKAQGERLVRDAFPTAPIFRPSIVFGPGDGFFTRFALMATNAPALPLIDGGKTKFQPVYVGDVADALLKGCADRATDGQTYELGGPKVYSFKELLRYLLKVLNRKRFLVPMPLSVARLQAQVFELLPEPMITRDQLKMLSRDNVVSGRHPGLKDLGITPTPLEVVVPHYLDALVRKTEKLPAT